MYNDSDRLLRKIGQILDQPRPGSPILQGFSPHVRTPYSSTTICSAWRDVSAFRFEGTSWTISYQGGCSSTSSDLTSATEFARFLNRSAPAVINVFVYIFQPDLPDIRIVPTSNIIQSVTPHLDRVRSLEVIVSPELSVTARTMWYRRPWSFISANPPSLHSLQHIHLQDISILRASHIQFLFDNSPNLREVVIYRGGEEIERDIVPSTLALNHLVALFVDLAVFDIIVEIGYRMPNIRVLAVPSDSANKPWAKVPELDFPSLSELLVGGLANDQLLPLLRKAPDLESLWLQRCAADSAFIEAMCTKIGYTRSYPVPNLKYLRIEEGSLHDADVTKLVSRRSSPLTHSTMRTICTTVYPGSNPALLLPHVDRGIQELHLLDCQNTTNNAAKAIKRGMLGAWSNSKDAGRGGSAGGAVGGGGGPSARLKEPPSAWDWFGVIWNSLMKSSS